MNEDIKCTTCDNKNFLRVGQMESQLGSVRSIFLVFFLPSQAFVHHNLLFSRSRRNFSRSMGIKRKAEYAENTLGLLA